MILVQHICRELETQIKGGIIEGTYVRDFMLVLMDEIQIEGAQATQYCCDV